MLKDEYKVYEEKMKKSIESVANDFAAAGRLQLKLKPICDTLFCEVNPIPVKTALNLMGLEAGELRLPLCPPADASMEKLKLALSAWDLLPES